MKELRHLPNEINQRVDKTTLKVECFSQNWLWFLGKNENLLSNGHNMKFQVQLFGKSIATVSNQTNLAVMS